MKTFITIIVSLTLSHLLMAGVTISGIDFAKSESMASILKGVNQVRGSQDVILSLDQTRRLGIMDSSKHPLVDILFAVGADGIRMSSDKTRLSRKEFIVKLNALVKAFKAAGHQPYIYLYFDDGISGAEGYQLLTDICDSGISGLIFCREESRKERASRLEKEREIKPSSPSSKK